ncbi:MAG TPA: hypothetical protein VGL58_13575 [Caulobacteraceae bacterium]|jgi:hypothetical protein
MCFRIVAALLSSNPMVDDPRKVSPAGASVKELSLPAAKSAA